MRLFEIGYEVSVDLDEITVIEGIEAGGCRIYLNEISFTTEMSYKSVKNLVEGLSEVRGRKGVKSFKDEMAQLLAGQTTPRP